MKGKDSEAVALAWAGNGGVDAAWGVPEGEGGEGGRLVEIQQEGGRPRDRGNGSSAVW